jgi:23S rRNA pseudouridine2605 synthase
MRLNKYLAAGGVASRRKADELIADGHVKVNGRLITTLGVAIYFISHQV